MPKRLTTEEFIFRCSKIHNNLYDYSKTKYVTSVDAVTIICPIHKEFQQKAILHLHGSGCFKCNGSVKKTTEEAVADFKKVYDNLYDYSLVDYKNNKTKVKVICTIDNHGVFEVRPDNHLHGSKCPSCYGKFAKTTNIAVEDFKKIHGDVYDYSMVKYVNSRDKVKIICKVDGHGVFYQDSHDHLGGHGCPKCGVRASAGEKEISNWLVEHGMLVDKNTRYVEDKKYKYELDIFIPSTNIAIEYNGLEFHHTLGNKYVGSNKNNKPKYYHRDKSNWFKEQHGIRIIHIWEHEWLQKKEIVKSVLRMQLGISRRKVYGRKCELTEIKVNEFKPFMESSHLQGHVSCTKYYGLYFEDELVSAMGFSKSTQGKDAEWELKRFSNKINTVVFGGAAKLFKHFLREFNNPSVKSFSQDRLFSGNMYEQLGFEFVKTLPPTYFYHKHQKTIIPRRSAQKKNLHKIIPGYVYDPNVTEVQTMNENGYFQVFDTGMSYWLKK